MKNSEYTFEKDFANRKITVTAHFKAPLAVVWDAFTNAETLEKWWAPKPFTVVTKEFDFRVGGRWLYYMLSPKGEKYWGIMQYQSIEPEKSLVMIDGLSDENGHIDNSMPVANWTNNFSESGDVTIVTNTLIFETEDGVHKILEKGFEQGYSMGLSQLSEMLKSKQEH